MLTQHLFFLTQIRAFGNGSTAMRHRKNRSVRHDPSFVASETKLTNGKGALSGRKQSVVQCGMEMAVRKSAPNQWTRGTTGGGGKLKEFCCCFWEEKELAQRVSPRKQASKHEMQLRVKMRANRFRDSKGSHLRNNH